MLELKHVKPGFGSTLYETGELRIHPGTLSVLIGANGAGKSTLLDAIALGQSAGGDILLYGDSLPTLSLRERARKIALVESRFTGAAHLSLGEYLELGRFPHTKASGRLHAEDYAIVNRYAAHFQLEQLRSQSTATLSDGERQRAGIARAFIQQTPVILLDEPTSFLDYPNKRRIMQLLRDTAREEQKIILLSSHDLELYLDYADHFYIINPATGLLEHYEASAVNLNLICQKAFQLPYTS